MNLFSPKVIDSFELVTAVADRHSLSLRRFRPRDLLVIRFSASVIAPVGWRRHGDLFWRILGPNDAYLTVRTVDRIALTLSVTVYERRTFDDRKPFRAFRRRNWIVKTVINAEFKDDATALGTVKAPEYGTQFLIKMVDHAHPDPDTDREGSYKIGYPIVCMPYAQTPGRRESRKQWIAAGNAEADWPGLIAIVRVPAIDQPAVVSFPSAQTEDDQGQPLIDENDTLITYRRCRWIINRDLMSAWIRNALTDAGEVTVSYTDLRRYMRRIRDQAQYRDAD